MKIFKKFLLIVTQNNVCTFGSALTTASALVFSSFFILELFGFHWGPYLGLLTYVFIPALFALGLVLIAIGSIYGKIQRKKQDPAKQEAQTQPFVFNFTDTRFRKLFSIFVAMTILNLMIVATASYKAVHVMDSTTFCGTTCHVMAPEYTAYKRLPHAHVDCVECHIGSGADHFLKAKLQGSWQLISLAFNLYERPIPVPVKNLRPARETCEKCHWPEKFIGDQLKVLTLYKDDEKNTELKTALLLHVGGTQATTSKGIHWHVDPKVKVRYLSDKKRGTIFDVELTKQDGTKETFVTKADKPEGEKLVWRDMDCIDCHSRPAHTLVSAPREINGAMQTGLLSRELPFLRREAMKLVKEEYASHEAAKVGIKKKLIEFYAQNYPDIAASKKKEIESSADQLGVIYASNVFPEMKVTWGTYVNRIGHEEGDGCNRCHDGEHKNAAGKSITDDCDTCHKVLAQEEKDPKVLSEFTP